MKIASTAVLVASICALVLATSAQSVSRSHWYWSPAFCKATLQNHGVVIGDGRSYNVAKAYCVGLHNHCWISQGLRRYKVFIAVMRSYDGVIRRTMMTVTGRATWSGSAPKIIEPYMSASEFIGAYGPAAWSVARSENAAGCWDDHP